jgi:hypothetical protein
MRSRHITFVLAVLFAVYGAGCAAFVAGGAIGGGTAVYVKGQVEQTFNNSVPQVHEATLAALKELNMPVVEDVHDETSAKMKSVVASGEEVWIDISALSNTASKVTLRVGTMGDEGKSTTILNTIHKNL